MKYKPAPITVASLLSVAAIAFPVQHAHAADRIWSNATGTWDTVTANWSGSTFANGDNALFSAATGNSALTLGASVNPLNFRSNGATTPTTTTITGGAAFTLSLGNGTAGTGNVTAADGSSAYAQNLTYAMSGGSFALVAGSGTTATPAIWNVASTKSFTINGTSVVDLNANTVNLTGAGTATIQLTNAAGILKSTGGTGTFNVNAGNLALAGGSSAACTFDSSIAVNVASGASLTCTPNTSGATATYAMTMNMNGGKLVGGSGSPTISGPMHLLADSTIEATNNTNFTGTIDGGGKLTKTGSSTLTLSNSNTYTGTTSITGGTLQLGNGSALGSGSVLVDGGGSTLQVNAGLTVNNSLTLKRGATSRAILNLGDGATWSGGITVDNTNVTTGNFAAIHAGGLSPTSPSIVSGPIGFSVLGTPSATSQTLILRTSDRFGKVTGPVSLANGYVALLDTSKWEFSNASNSWGTLDISNAGAITTVGAANTLSPSGIVTSTVGGTLRLNDQAETTGYSQTIAGLSGNVKVGLLAGTATLTLDTPADQSSSGAISGDLSLVKSGPAKQTLTGVNTYLGSTTINGGTLALGTTGELPMGDLTISSATLDLRKGTASRLQLVNHLTLSNATLDIGLNADTDRIDAVAATVSGTNTVKLHGSIPIGSYHIIDTAAPLGGTFVLDTSNAAGGFTSYSGAKVGTNYILTVSGTPTPGTAYWRGDVSSIWNDSSVAPNSNWATNSAGTTDTAQIPGVTTDVFFSAATAANTNVTLGADTTINSLTFESGTATVGGPNTLTITGSLASSGNGLDVLSGANATLNTGSFVCSTPSVVQAGGTLTLNGGGLGTGPLTVDGALKLNMNLTTGTLGGAGSISRSTAGTSALTVSSSVPLAFGGSIADGSGTVSLNKTGTNTLTLSGSSSYSGGTTITQADGTKGIIVGHASALGTGPVLANGTQQFDSTLSVDAGLTVTNALTLKRGLSGSGRAILALGDGSNWNGNITLDNTSASGFAVIASGGTTPATASIVSGNIGFSVLGTPSATSQTLVLRSSDTFGKVTGSVSLSNGYVALFDTSRWEFSNASNTWGTLDINNAGAIATVGAANTLPAGGVVFSNTGGTLQLNNQAGTTAYDQSIAGLSGNVKVGLTTGTATLTLNTAANQSSSGAISGAISLVKTGTASQTLSGVNTHTGDTMVNGGTLILADNAQLKFVPGANGVNNQLKGTGTVELSGDFNIDLSGTDLTNGNSWTLVDVGSLSEVFLSSFQVVGFTETANVHKLVDGANTWTFTEATGVLSLSVGGGYDSWAASKGLTGLDAAFDADPDHDGLDNGLEFVLGGEPNPANPGSNSAALLPTISQSAGNLTFTFKRKDISESGATLKFQWSTDLTFPSPANDVPVGATDSTTDTITVDVTEDAPDADTDTIVITIPAAKAAGGKLFGRLSVAQAP
jgi:fibronectin-binding autotransporter adhesin